jgi:transposase
MEDDLVPASIPVPVRQTILHRWLKGESVAKLAEDLQLSVRTVRHLVRRFAQRGAEAVAPDYDRCGTKKIPVDSDSFQKAVDMRQQHPRWGGGLIRVMLQEADQPCPSARTLQRWFRNGKLSPAPPGRRPVGEQQRTRCPHETWQMDAVDQLRLAGGARVSWLRLVDECSGAVLKTVIFPPRLLGSGAAGHGARDVARGFFPVGTASTPPRRQRLPVGIER